MWFCCLQKKKKKSVCGVNKIVKVINKELAGREDPFTVLLFLRWKKSCYGWFGLGGVWNKGW